MKMLVLQATGRPWETIILNEALPCTAREKSSQRLLLRWRVSSHTGTSTIDQEFETEPCYWTQKSAAEGWLVCSAWRNRVRTAAAFRLWLRRRRWQGAQHGPSMNAASHDTSSFPMVLLKHLRVRLCWWFFIPGSHWWQPRIKGLCLRATPGTACHMEAEPNQHRTVDIASWANWMASGLTGYMALSGARG